MKTCSTSYTEMMQKLADKFIEETGKDCYTTKELAVWAVRSGEWEPPPDLIIKKCREDFSRALREEHFTDNKGSSIRAKHVARVINGDRQLHLWADIRTAPHEHIEASFDQRRQQIVGECRQLNRDNEYYQEIKPERPKIQIYFDFRDDVEEGKFSHRYPPKQPR